MYRVIKRLLDISVSGITLLLLSPLFVFLLVIIRLDSKGNPLFFHSRVGKGGKPFNMVKFRSMVSGADKKGPYWTADNDPRITKVGQILRRTSLDELPQLWNVLVGDMSLIGPRPDTPAQEKDYPAHVWRARHRVRPGITGMAQAYGRSNLTPRRRMAYDRLYVMKPSVMRDIAILVKTAQLVLMREGVN